MCGIAVHLDLLGKQQLEKSHTAVLKSLEARGPDGRGVFTDEHSGITLFHTRLSVVDLSMNGHQPMTSNSGRYVIAYNGEIYNVEEMKNRIIKDRGAQVWSGHSDTEVLLSYFDSYGLAETVKMANGMFAIALWDRREQELSLIRDANGQKPLFYAFSHHQLSAASNLSTVLLLQQHHVKIDECALADFITHGYIASPQTIYESVFKVEPGTFLRFSTRENIRLIEKTDFSVDKKRISRRPLSDGDEESYVRELDMLLTSAVQSHMCADVPVGVFLSGGIDSSIVACKAASVAPSRISTFTVSFPNSKHDEGCAARRIAESLNTDHHEVLISNADVVEVFDQMSNIWNEPFADPSQIAACVLARSARNHITVALCGDGGDEYFSGYRKYALGRFLFTGTKYLPTHMRRGLSFLLQRFANATIGASTWSLQRKMRALSHWIDFSDIDELSRNIDSVIGARILCPGKSSRQNVGWDKEPIQAFARYDQRYYLPDGLMVKSDKSSMAFGLEIRAPFLDDKIVAFSRSMPSWLSHSAGESKRPLRCLARKMLPPGIGNSPKAGFSVPLRQWLNGPLKDRVSFYLSPSLIDNIGFVDHSTFKRIYDLWSRGNSSFDRLVWNVLVLSQWNHHRLQGKHSGSGCIT